MVFSNQDKGHLGSGYIVHSCPNPHRKLLNVWGEASGSRCPFFSPKRVEHLPSIQHVIHTFFSIFAS